MQIAVETVENIDTVASLGLEEKFYTDFGNKIKKPYRWRNNNYLLFHKESLRDAQVG